MQNIIKNLFLVLGLTIYFSYSMYADSLPNSSFKEILKGSQDILPADESFKFSAFQQEDRIILTWELKENCFLYKNKFQINTLPKDILDIHTLEVPILISDEYFGEVEVFYEKLTKSFVLNPTTKKVIVKYQGCNAKGFCYPLISKQLIIKKGEILISKELKGINKS
jgi:thiol:disulfide interchange protein DsbD